MVRFSLVEVVLAVPLLRGLSPVLRNCTCMKLQNGLVLLVASYTAAVSLGNELL